MSKIEVKLQTPKEIEKETFLAEIEKVPLGNVLVSAFRNNTIPESRELIGGAIYGKVQKVGNNPCMRLQLEDSKSEKGAALEIFREESECGYKLWDPDVIFFAGEITLSRFSSTYDIYVRFKSGIIEREPVFTIQEQLYSNRLFLNDSYHNWLIEVVSEVASKASQIPREKIEEKIREGK